jgi:hypothetical protein
MAAPAHLKYPLELALRRGQQAPDLSRQRVGGFQAHKVADARKRPEIHRAAWSSSLFMATRADGAPSFAAQTRVVGTAMGVR